jgi:phenylpyruvate tautomerase PptA (4-oxalocrotonate tautomerase family)
MPLVRIDHRAGKSDDFKKALSDGVYEAMRVTFNVPEDDRFQVLHEHAGTAIIRPASYLEIEYSDDLVVIQITCNEGRTLEMKKALYAGIADRLVTNPGLCRQDILINLVEVKKENWSFGNGIAQYAK